MAAHKTVIAWEKGELWPLGKQKHAKHCTWDTFQVNRHQLDDAQKILPHLGPVFGQQRITKLPETES